MLERKLTMMNWYVTISFFACECLKKYFSLISSERYNKFEAARWETVDMLPLLLSFGRLH
jgi:hypothetical protein